MSTSVPGNDYFLEEAEELLADLEKMAVELEERPHDFELLNKMFRVLHTLKGSGSMFGFDELAAFSHDMETLFDLLRDHSLEAGKEIIDLTLAARDQMEKMLFDPAAAKESQEERKRIQHAFRDLTWQRDDSREEEKREEANEAAPEDEGSPTEGTERSFRIRFRPEGGIFERGTKLLPLIEELHGLGSCLATAHTHSLPRLEELDPEQCKTEWTFLVTTPEDENAIRDVFIFLEDDAEISIDLIDEDRRMDLEEDYKAIGQILAERGTIREEDIDEIIASRERFGDIALEKGLTDTSEVESAVEEQQYVRKRRKARRREQVTASSIRVKSEKLDTLINLVGELVTLQASLAQYYRSHSDDNGYGQSDLGSISEQLERLTAGLRDNTMNLRMVPLTETFDSFSRLVRDLGGELKKQVQLKTYGSDIELDKQIIDELKDPLIHTIRNAVDHGIETEEERHRNGKTVRGTVTVGAEYVGANVVIQVRDDGAGLDTAKVYRKAQERGLLSDEEGKDGSLSEREILGLIFRPGFSTAEEATAVSGRGVGMDVVKRNIERLHGSVEIDTQPGEGSTMRLTIPLTLSIIDGLLFSVGEGYYIVHLDAVEECFELDSSRYSESATREYVYIREQPISCIDLARIFEPRGERPKIRQGIVVRGDREKVALLVDTIHRQYQTVIKPLNAALKDLQEVSGSTILGDGSVAFILDVKKLVEAASTAATREERVG